MTAQKDSVERIMGDTTPEAINDSEEELGDISVKFKSHHFPLGQKIGHLAVISGEDQMQTIYRNPGYTYVVPTNQGAYNVTLQIMQAQCRDHRQSIYTTE